MVEKFFKNIVNRINAAKQDTLKTKEDKDDLKLEDMAGELIEDEQKKKDSEAKIAFERLGFKIGDKVQVVGESTAGEKIEIIGEIKSFFSDIDLSDDFYAAIGTGEDDEDKVEEDIHIKLTEAEHMKKI